MEKKFNKNYKNNNFREDYKNKKRSNEKNTHNNGYDNKNNKYSNNNKNNNNNNNNLKKEKENENYNNRKERDFSKDNRTNYQKVDEFTEENMYNDIVEGRNAVLELLNSDRDINKIFVQNGDKHGSINKIIAIALENKVVVKEVEKSKLDFMSKTQNHQGVIAVVPPYNYCEVEDILNFAKEKNEDAFILILDNIEDPHNLGSIIRTAETAGVHGIIIPKRRSVTVNSTVSKVSAGAVEHVKIARVNNINDTIRKLKENGLWIIGTDGEAKTYYYNQDLKGDIAIVIGNEGDGISRLVKENCDILVKIPMKGKIESLNASVSAGIIIYEAVKQRK